MSCHFANSAKISLRSSLPVCPSTVHLVPDLVFPTPSLATPPPSAPHSDCTTTIAGSAATIKAQNIKQTGNSAFTATGTAADIEMTNFNATSVPRRKYGQERDGDRKAPPLGCHCVFWTCKAGQLKRTVGQCKGDSATVGARMRSLRRLTRALTAKRMPCRISSRSA